MSFFYRSLYIGVFLLTTALFFSFTPSGDPFERVVVALNEGNIETLTPYLDNRIEITLLNKTDSYSKSQAAIILKSFFSEHPSKGFKLIHKGASKKGSQFGIGSLSTEKGNFRVTLFFQQKGDRVFLQELRIKESGA